MYDTVGRKTFIFGGAAVVLLCLLLGSSVLWRRPAPSTLTLHVAGPPRITNDVLIVNMVISNGTPRTLNVVDDPAGNPYMFLDAGADDYPRGSGNHVVGLGFGGNTLKLNLASGTSLTNTVNVSNAPARFRLMVDSRDLSMERLSWWREPLARVLPQTWSDRLGTRELPRATSEWVEIKRAEGSDPTMIPRKEP